VVLSPLALTVPLSVAVLEVTLVTVFVVTVGDCDVSYKFMFTCTGVFLLLFVPSPNWPDEFSPHVQTVPSDLRNTVK